MGWLCGPRASVMHMIMVAVVVAVRVLMFERLVLVRVLVRLGQVEQHPASIRAPPASSPAPGAWPSIPSAASAPMKVQR